MSFLIYLQDLDRKQSNSSNSGKAGSTPRKSIPSSNRKSVCMISFPSVSVTNAPFTQTKRVQRDTRQNNDLTLPRYRLATGQKTFTHRGAKLFNSLAKDIRDTGNRNMYVIKPGFFKRMKNRHGKLEHRVSHRIEMKFNTFCDFALNLQSL